MVKSNTCEKEQAILAFCHSCQSKFIVDYTPEIAPKEVPSRCCPYCEAPQHAAIAMWRLTSSEADEFIAMNPNIVRVNMSDGPKCATAL